MPLPGLGEEERDEGRPAARVTTSSRSIDEVPEPRHHRPARRHRRRSAGPGCAAPTCTSSRASGTRRWAPPLPYILGHENAGWVHEIGSAVTNVAVGDTVILHPDAHLRAVPGLPGRARTCTASTARSPACPATAGWPSTCSPRPGPASSSTRSTRPKDVAALADAGITAYHAVRKAIPLLYPGTTCVVIGRGRARPHRHPVPGRADRHQRSSWWTATRTRSSWPSSSAPSTPWSPTAARSQAVKDLTGGAGRRGRARLRRRAGRRERRVRDDPAGPARTSSSATAARCTSRRWTSSPPSATSSATSSAPTTTWPS